MSYAKYEKWGNEEIQKLVEERIEMIDKWLEAQDIDSVGRDFYALKKLLKIYFKGR